MAEIDQKIFQEPRKTFMEILKVNNREVPFANLLGFFFRPRERHGLGLQFINALLDTPCTDIGHADEVSSESIVRNRGYRRDTIDLSPMSKINIATVDVVVEQPTGSAKRIDLLVSSDEFVLCIEFKINHDLDNPLSDYKEHVERYHSSKRHHYIILTPYKKEAVGEAKRFFEKNTEFKQVILSHFFSKIMLALPDGYDIGNEHNEYYRYFCDLVQTVENRKIRSVRHHILNMLNRKLKRFKIPSALINNNGGGYLKISMGIIDMKVRITESGWQLEKWSGKTPIEKVIINDKEIGYQRLTEHIRRYHNGNYQQQ